MSPERLVCHDRAGKQVPASGLEVELPKDVADQMRHLGEQAAFCRIQGSYSGYGERSGSSP
jgi:hypothetical protein